MEWMEGYNKEWDRVVGSAQALIKDTDHKLVAECCNSKSAITNGCCSFRHISFSISFLDSNLLKIYIALITATYVTLKMSK